MQFAGLMLDIVTVGTLILSNTPCLLKIKRKRMKRRLHRKMARRKIGNIFECRSSDSYPVSFAHIMIGYSQMAHLEQLILPLCFKDIQVKEVLELITLQLWSLKEVNTVCFH